MSDRFWAWTMLLFMCFMVFASGFLMAQTVKLNNHLQWQQNNWNNEVVGYVPRPESE